MSQEHLRESRFNVATKAHDLRAAGARLGILRSLSASQGARLLQVAGAMLDKLLETPDDRILRLNPFPIDAEFENKTLNLLQDLVDKTLDRGLENGGRNLLAMGATQLTIDLCDHCEFFEGVELEVLQPFVGTWLNKKCLEAGVET